MTLRGKIRAVGAKGIWREEGQEARSAWSRWETFPEQRCIPYSGATPFRLGM